MTGGDNEHEKAELRELAKLCLSGGEAVRKDALARIYVSLHEPVLSRLRARFPFVPPDELDNFLHEQWERHAESFEEYLARQSNQSLASWIFGAVRNQLSNYLRKQNRHVSFDDTFALEKDPIGSSPILDTLESDEQSAGYEASGRTVLAELVHDASEALRAAELEPMADIARLVGARRAQLDELVAGRRPKFSAKNIVLHDERTRDLIIKVHISNPGFGELQRRKRGEKLLSGLDVAIAENGLDTWSEADRVDRVGTSPRPTLGGLWRVIRLALDKFGLWEWTDYETIIAYHAALRLQQDSVLSEDGMHLSDPHAADDWLSWLLQCRHGAGNRERVLLTPPPRIDLDGSGLLKNHKTFYQWRRRTRSILNEIEPRERIMLFTFLFERANKEQ